MLPPQVMSLVMSAGLDEHYSPQVMPLARCEELQLIRVTRREKLWKTVLRSSMQGFFEWVLNSSVLRLADISHSFLVNTQSFIKRMLSCCLVRLLLHWLRGAFTAEKGLNIASSLQVRFLVFACGKRGSKLEFEWQHFGIFCWSFERSWGLFWG